MFYEQPKMELLGLEDEDDVITSSGLFEGEEDDGDDDYWSDWW